MSDSDLEPGEYKQQAARKNRSLTPPGVDHARSKSRSRSKESVHSRRSGSPRRRSYSRSRSHSRGSARSRSHSYGKRSRSKDNYRSPKRSSYSRRSRSYDKKRRSYSRSRSRSRGSRSPMSGRKRHIGDRMNPPSGKCLGVFGLSLYTTESDLQDVFSRYGYIDKCNIVIDQKTGRSRGFGFVYFEDTNDAVEAKERANGMDLDGRKIRVDFSITKRAHTPTPGMYVGRPAPHHSSGPPRRYDDRGGGDRYDRYDRYDNRDRRGYDKRGGGGGGGGGRYDDRDRYNSRRSPSPYYSSHRRSPSPYGRDRRY